MAISSNLVFISNWEFYIKGLASVAWAGRVISQQPKSGSGSPTLHLKLFRAPLMPCYCFKKCMPINYFNFHIINHKFPLFADEQYTLLLCVQISTPLLTIYIKFIIICISRNKDTAYKENRLYGMEYRSIFLATFFETRCNVNLGVDRRAIFTWQMLDIRNCGRSCVSLLAADFLGH